MSIELPPTLLQPDPPRRPPAHRRLHVQRRGGRRARPAAGTARGREAAQDQGTLGQRATAAAGNYVPDQDHKMLHL